MISSTSLGAATAVASAALEVAEAAAKGASKASTKRAEAPHAAGAGAAAAIAKAVVAGLAKPARTAAKGRTRRTSGAGYAKPSSATRTTKGASDPLSFLKDPKLSIEEKLMRLLAYLNDKWEKEMQEKMDQLAGKAPPKSSSSKKKGGVLGAIGSVVKGALGPAGIALEALKNPAVRGFLSKIGGPVLAAGATALGAPQLAPLLLKHGSKIIEFAAGVASSLDGAAASQGASSQGSSAASSKKEELTMMEIKRLMEKQSEMFALVSNILKVGHDTRMQVIGNIR